MKHAAWLLFLILSIKGFKSHNIIKGKSQAEAKGIRIKKTTTASQIDKPRERKPRARKKRKATAAAKDLEQEPSLILEFLFSSSLLSCLDVPDNIHESSLYSHELIYFTRAMM